MTDLLLVLLINFFALYTTSQYLAVLKKEEQKKTEWDFDFFDSLLYVKKSVFLYKIEPSTYVTLKADDLKIDNTQKVIRYVHFNLTSDIKKDGKNLHFNLADRNAVFIKNKAIWVQNCYLIFNDSKIFFNAWADKKKNYNLEVFSKKRCCRRFNSY